MTGDTGRAQSASALVARSAFIEISGAGAVRALSFVRLTVLARIFLPSDYGAYTTGLLVVAPALLVLNSGFRQYAAKVAPERLAGAFTAGVALTSVLFLVAVFALWALGPAVAVWLHDPDLRVVLLILSLSLLDGPLGMAQALLDRRLRFGVAKVVEAAGLLSGLAATILLYLGGVRPAFAMAGGQAVMTALTGLGFWWVARPIPDLRATREDFMGAARFALPLVGGAVFGIVASRADDFGVRYFWGNQSLGLYAVAFYVPALLQEVAFALDRVSLPVFSRIEGQAALRTAFTDSTRIIAVLTVPVGFGIALFAAPLVTLAFGPAWEGSAPLMSIFALAFGLKACAGLNWGVLAYLSDETAYVGRVSVAMALAMVVLGLPLIAIFGPVGGAWYTVVQALAISPLLRFPLIKRVLGDLSFLSAVVRPLLAVLALGGIVIVLGGRSLSPVAGLFAFLVFVATCIGMVVGTDKTLRSTLRTSFGSS